MPRYLAKLLERKETAEGTMAFYFGKPEGFQFKAGQFLNFTLVNPPETDPEGNTRTFSIASAPFENDLMVATRMRDTAFKRVWKTMPLKTESPLEGPYGSLTLHQDAVRPAVFLAGGIGITPFRSIILHAHRANLNHRRFLFYSNRRPEDAPFLAELQALARENARFTFVGTMTEMQKSQRPWSGETGYVNRAMLDRIVGDLAAPVYYIAGPPGMVAAMQDLLTGAGVSEDFIRAEEFAGY